MEYEHNKNIDIENIVIPSHLLTRRCNLLDYVENYGLVNFQNLNFAAQEHYRSCLFTRKIIYTLIVIFRQQNYMINMMDDNIIEIFSLIETYRNYYYKPTFNQFEYLNLELGLMSLDNRNEFVEKLYDRLCRTLIEPEITWVHACYIKIVWKRSIDGSVYNHDLQSLKVKTIIT